MPRCPRIIVPKKGVHYEEDLGFTEDHHLVIALNQAVIDYYSQKTIPQLLTLHESIGEKARDFFVKKRTIDWRRDRQMTLIEQAIEKIDRLLHPRHWAKYDDLRANEAVYEQKYEAKNEKELKKLKSRFAYYAQEAEKQNLIGLYRYYDDLYWVLHNILMEREMKK